MRFEIKSTEAPEAVSRRQDEGHARVKAGLRSTLGYHGVFGKARLFAEIGHDQRVI